MSEISTEPHHERPAETVPAAAANSVGESRWRQRVFKVGFLTACTVAMFGWLTGLSWAAISVLIWLSD